MFAKVPRNTVSVWRRIRSTVSAGLRLTVVAVPEAGVKVIDAMVTWKERSEGLAGRVSAPMVRATEPLPAPQLAPVQPMGVFGPLQEAEKTASKRRGRNGRTFLQIM